MVNLERKHTIQTEIGFMENNEKIRKIKEDWKGSKIKEREGNRRKLFKYLNNLKNIVSQRPFCKYLLHHNCRE